MATRFYLEADATTAPTPQANPLITPAHDASWEIIGSTSRRWMMPAAQKLLTPVNSTASVSETNSGVVDVLVRQFISPPLAAYTFDGTSTVKGQIRVSQNSTAADLRAQVVIRVVSRDGTTVRGTLLASDTTAWGSGGSASEFSTSLTNRKFPLASSSPATLSGLAILEGDRLVVEIGYRAENLVTTSYSAAMRFGSDQPSDHAENETATTNDNPWIEFSDTLTFDRPIVEVTQVGALVAGEFSDPQRRITQVGALVSGEVTDPERRITQVVLLVAGRNDDANPPLTTVAAIANTGQAPPGPGVLVDVTSATVELTTVAATAQVWPFGLPGALETAIQDAGPIAWWKFNETSGTSAEDYGTGTDADGTYTGGYSLMAPGTDAAPNYSVYLNGTSGYVSIGAVPAKLQFAAGAPFSIEAWAAFDGETLPYPGAAIVSEAYSGDNTVRYMLGFHDNDKYPTFGWYNGSWRFVKSSVQVTDGNFHHYVGTFDGTQLRLYLDGTLVAGPWTPGGTQPGGTETLYIGRRWDNYDRVYWNGYIDNVAFYDYALASDTVDDHSNLLNVGPVGIVVTQVMAEAAVPMTLPPLSVTQVMAEAAVPRYPVTVDVTDVVVEMAVPFDIAWWDDFILIDHELWVDPTDRDDD